jgi:hypothetical protein
VAQNGAGCDGTRKNTSDPAVFGENNRVMLLPAVPAKEGRVQPSLGVLRVKTLTFEGDPPPTRSPQRCIDMPRT